ncbi:MATE family efflux transporter [Alterisphingorhabdus coralli]|uniref:Multidrug-efflux transporter n=1 Tax=Alterisphingorhabdus coralli TaxID=3071408 RepID=A0AA97F6F5_9SPHN|nr:MATE family efflux transporter [Parasphingorhabdus sp. SCSIO 66989]WOE74153.1 MATE family efflux transporter [Parasphingorhabdus sp. SCSIO 66989]
MVNLSWPLILTNLTMSLISATDVLMIGWLGAEDLAAASLGFNLCMLAAIFCMGLMTASAPMFASEFGRMHNSVRDVRRTFRQSFWVAVTIIIPIWLVLWQAEALLIQMGQKPELAAKAEIYVRVYMLSILPFMMLMVMRNFISALERPLWSLVIGIIGVLANILVNYALIFGNFGFPALGIMGAGIASIACNALMVMGMIIVLTSDKQFRRYRLFGNFWRADWARYRAVWSLGLPIAVSFGLEGGVFSIAVILMGWIDTLSVAAHAIALQIASISFMVPMGLAQAATVRVGLGHGRRDPAMIHRAGWTAFVLGTGFMTLMALSLWLFPVELASLFIDYDNPDAYAVLALAVDFLMLAAIFQIADGAQVVGAGMLRGLQDTRIPMVFAAFGYWVVGIGVGAGLAFWADWDGVGIWTGLASGLAVVAILMLTRWMMRDRLGLVPEPT